MFEWREPGGWSPPAGGGAEVWTDKSELDEKETLEKWKVEKLRSLYNRFYDTIGSQRYEEEDEDFQDEVKKHKELILEALDSDEHALETLAFINRYSQHSSADAAGWYFFEHVSQHVDTLHEGIQGTDRTYTDDCIDLLRDQAFSGGDTVREEIVHIFSQELRSGKNREDILNIINSFLYDEAENMSNDEYQSPADAQFQNELITCVRGVQDVLEKRFLIGEGTYGEQIETAQVFAHEINIDTRVIESDAEERERKLHDRYLDIHEHPRFKVFLEQTPVTVAYLCEYIDTAGPVKGEFIPIITQCIVESKAEDTNAICAALRSFAQECEKPETAGELAGELLKQPDTQSHTAAYAILQELLEPAELGSEVIEAWLSGGKLEQLSTIVASNIQTITAIEQHEKGIAKTLHQEFGICHFARYPEEMLIRQCDLRDEHSEYGVIANPIDDHNGAFYTAKGIYTSLMTEMKNSDTEIRIIENSGKRDLGRSLNQLHKRYFKAPEAEGNKSHRLSFMLLGGHGTPRSLRQGSGEHRERSHLRLEDLDKLDVKTLTALFEEGATIVLDSCLTGREHGLAQKISEKVQNILVIAPEKSAYIETLTTRKVGNKIEFIVKYEDYKKNKDGEKVRVPVVDKAYKNRHLKKN